MSILFLKFAHLFIIQKGEEVKCLQKHFDYHLIKVSKVYFIFSRELNFFCYDEECRVFEKSF